MDRTDRLEPLRRELRAEPPPALGALADGELDDLAAAVRDARRAQSEALASAAGSALGHLPRPLRGPVKRTLGL